jgi:hypothetical protein
VAIARGATPLRRLSSPVALLGAVFRVAPVLPARFLATAALGGLRSAAPSFVAVCPASRDKSSSNHAGA